MNHYRKATLLESFINLSKDRRLLAENDDHPQFTYDVTPAELNKLGNEISDLGRAHNAKLVQFVEGVNIRIYTDQRMEINCDGMKIIFKERKDELSNKRN